MTIKTILPLLLVLLLSKAVFSQRDVQVNILPSKISTDVSVLIPQGELFVLERYHFFKYNYWVSATDTLRKLDNGMLQGKSATLNPESFTKTVCICDSTINRIRNAALNHTYSSTLSHIARKEIGYDNKEFQTSVHELTEQDLTTPHDEFRIRAQQWLEAGKEKVNEIKQKKMDRLAWIKDQGNTIDKEFINSFLHDYGVCETDHAAILQLINNNTDNFLSVCNALSDMNFYDVKLKLENQSDREATNAAITKLKSSPVSTRRKSKLIKALQRRYV